MTNAQDFLLETLGKHPYNHCEHLIIKPFGGELQARAVVRTGQNPDSERINNVVLNVSQSPDGEFKLAATWLDARIL